MRTMHVGKSEEPTRNDMGGDVSRAATREMHTDLVEGEGPLGIDEALGGLHRTKRAAFASSQLHPRSAQREGGGVGGRREGKHG